MTTEYSSTMESDLDDGLDDLSDLLVDFGNHYRPYFDVWRQNQWKKAEQYIYGHVFNGKRRNLLQIAWDVTESDPQQLQHFITDSPWKKEPLIEEIQREVVELAGDEKDIALVIDGSGFPKQGKMSAGVQRQYCGNLGKIANCQVGVFIAYSTPEWAILVDERLYMPKKWIKDKKRRKKCKVPEDLNYKKKSELGLEMILKCKKRGIEFQWASMDAHFGDQPWLLTELSKHGIVYMADISSNTKVFKQKARFEIPERKGNRGRKPTKEKLAPGQEQSKTVAQIIEEKNEWELIEIRDTERGKLWIEFVALRVWRKQDKKPKEEVWLVARKEIKDKEEISYSLSNAPKNLPLKKLAKMKCRRYWVERAIQDAKSEAKMDQYEVRGWKSWHHHMTVIILIMLLLLKIQLELKKNADNNDPGRTRSPGMDIAEKKNRTGGYNRKNMPKAKSKRSCKKKPSQETQKKNEGVY